MIEFPSTPWEAKLPREISPPIEAEWCRLKIPVEHTFTYFHLQLSVWKTATAEKSLPDGGGYRWVHKDELVHEALPSLMRRLSSWHWKSGPACESRLTPRLHHPMGFQRRLELGPRRTASTSFAMAGNFMWTEDSSVGLPQQHSMKA